MRNELPDIYMRSERQQTFQLSSTRRGNLHGHFAMPESVDLNGSDSSDPEPKRIDDSLVSHGFIFILTADYHAKRWSTNLIYAFFGSFCPLLIDPFISFSRFFPSPWLDWHNVVGRWQRKRKKSSFWFMITCEREEKVCFSAQKPFSWWIYLSSLRLSEESSGALSRCITNWNNWKPLKTLLLGFMALQSRVDEFEIWNNLNAFDCCVFRRHRSSPVGRIVCNEHVVWAILFFAKFLTFHMHSRARCIFSHTEKMESFAGASEVQVTTDLSLKYQKSFEFGEQQIDFCGVSCILRRQHCAVFDKLTANLLWDLTKHELVPAYCGFVWLV